MNSKEKRHRVQAVIPFALCKGDRIKWRTHNDTQNSGIVEDILSTQFVVMDDNGDGHVVRFDEVMKPT